MKRMGFKDRCGYCGRGFNLFQRMVKNILLGHVHPDCEIFLEKERLLFQLKHLGEND